MFIPDPDYDFLPILDPGRIRIRNTETKSCTWSLFMRSTCLCWASTAPRTLISASSRRLSVSDLGWQTLYQRLRQRKRLPLNDRSAGSILAVMLYRAVLRIRIRIRIRRIRMILGLLILDPDPLVSGTNPDPDPHIIMQK
jgi:hypothetical protein